MPLPRMLRRAEGMVDPPFLLEVVQVVARVVVQSGVSSVVRLVLLRVVRNVVV